MLSLTTKKVHLSFLKINNLSVQHTLQQLFIISLYVYMICHREVSGKNENGDTLPKWLIPNKTEKKKKILHEKNRLISTIYQSIAHKLLLELLWNLLWPN